MTADGMARARRNQRGPRHDVGRDAPVPAVVVGLPARADQKPALVLHHLEVWHAVAQVVFIRAAPDEERIAVQRAAVQERDVARVDAALDRLQVIAFLQALGHVTPLGRDTPPLQRGQLGPELTRAHVGPDYPGKLDAGIGFQTDAGTHAGLFGLGGQVYALPGHVVLPAVVGTTQAAFLVA